MKENPILDIWTLDIWIPDINLLNRKIKLVECEIQYMKRLQFIYELREKTNKVGDEIFDTQSDPSKINTWYIIVEDIRNNINDFKQNIISEQEQIQQSECELSIRERCENARIRNPRYITWYLFISELEKATDSHCDKINELDEKFKLQHALHGDLNILYLFRILNDFIIDFNKCGNVENFEKLIKIEHCSYKDYSMLEKYI